MASWLNPMRLRARVALRSSITQHSSDPGTSSVAHLRENLASVELNLSDDAVAALTGLAAPLLK